MASQSIDTFHTASSLDVGDNRYQIYRLESLAKETSLPVDRLPFLPQDPAGRTCSGARTTGTCRRPTSRRWRGGDAAGETRQGDRLHAGRASCCRTSPGFPPSWIWRPCGKASGGWAATRDVSTRSSPWTWSSTTRCRWITSAPFSRSPPTRNSSTSATSERLCVPALGPEGLRQLQRGAAGHGHRPSGEPGVSSARWVFTRQSNGDTLAYPDTLVGADSHTPMINGLGVVGWGVGGIEAEAAMLGQPLIMLIPEVIGFRLHGRLPEGATGHRPGADHRADAAQEGRGGEVRGVLRSGAVQPGAGGPGHHRQHGAGVRRHRGLLPGGQRGPWPT